MSVSPSSDQSSATPVIGTRWPVYWMLIANLVSNLGNYITVLAIPWFVLQTTGSAGKVGLVAAATLAPMVISTFIGGALTDRTSHRQLAVISDVLSGITVAAMPALYFTTGLNIYTLMVLVFLGAIFDGPGTNARMAMIPKLVRDSGMSLERVNSGFSIGRSLITLIGAPIAGLLIALVGPASVLWIDAATFALSAVIVCLMLPATTRPEPSGMSMLSDMKEGLRFLVRSRLLRSIALTAAIVNMVLNPIFVIGIPVYIENTGHGAGTYGLLMASLAAGGLAGSTLYGWIGDRLPARRTMIVGLLMITLPMFVITIQPKLIVMWLFLFVLSLGSGVINPLLVTFFHRYTPERMLGRVIGTFSSAAMLSSPIGVLAGGALIEIQGFGFTALMGTIAMALVVGLLTFNSALADLSGPEPAHTSS